MQRHVIDDPVARAFIEIGRAEGVAEGRLLAWEFFERTASIRAQLSNGLPRDFLDWLACKATENDFLTLKMLIEPSSTFKEVIDRSSLKFNDDGTYGYE